MTEQQHATRAPGDDPGSGAGGPPGPPARLRRDREHKMIGGVCAGLGRHCDMDPVIFRIVLSVLSVAGGIGLVFYGFAWLFVPMDGEDEYEARRMLSGRVDGPALAAVVFALVGCGLFLSMLNNGNLLSSGAVLALLLAGAGYWSRQRDTVDPDPLAAQAVADAPPEAKAPPAPNSTSWWREPVAKDGAQSGGTGYLWAPEGLIRDLGGTVGPPPGPRGPGPGKGQGDGTSSPTAAGGHWIGGWVVLAALVTGGIATGLSWDGSALGDSLQTGLALALAVLGLGIAVSALVGRTGLGSVIVAMITAGLLAGSTALPESITTRWTSPTWAPASAAELRPEYELGTGAGTLDLTGAAPAAGRTVASEVRLGAGQLKVVLPDGARVVMRVKVGLGDIQLPGEHRQDVNIAPGRDRTYTFEPTEPAGKGTPKKSGTIELDLDIGLGQAEVARAAS
ncbi:PspC domain-containing protein [Streptomyces uncialis]|uniref:PspC domain-containing protein n=1 Tax=Streptomyces uncialis TaxID=1048205 RepID=UPI0037AEEB79